MAKAKKRAKQRTLLALDLDGTLHAGDMAQLAVRELLGRNWLWGFAMLWWLRRGRTHLKHRLAEHAPLDMARLAWNEEVIAYARERSDCLLVLASGSTAAHAAAALAYLEDQRGLRFDALLASSGEVNLIGRRKAEALQALAQERGLEFEYIGDSPRQDPVVFEHARVSHFVNPTMALLDAYGSAASKIFAMPGSGGALRRLLGLLQERG